VFGPRAKENEGIRGVINSGHRNGATAGRCVVRGRVIETEDLASYCAVAMAGLDDLPDTIMDRSMVVRMRRRAPDETVEPWRVRINAAQGALLGAVGQVDGGRRRKSCPTLARNARRHHRP
jgi:hypothetical protein